MALILGVCAAYGAYKAYEQQASLSIDPEIKLEGKEKLSLTTMEQTIGLREFPFVTITFFDGSYKDASSHLRTRVQEILEKNPWLGGWLIRDAKDGAQLKILYDPQGEDMSEGHFQVYEPFVIPLSREKTPYSDYIKLLSAMNAAVPVNTELVGKNKPLWKIALIPDSDKPEERFALVVSMSRVGGDSHTYYKIMDMLNKDTTVVSLNPVRIKNFEETVKKEVGRKESEYLMKAIRHPVFDFSKNSEDPIVCKMFFINEDWVLQKKSRRVSLFDRDASVEATVVSMYSLLTTWFFALNEANVGLMGVNMRNRLRGCKVGELDAGSYLQSIPYTPEDYKTPGTLQNSLSSLHSSLEPTELPEIGYNTKTSISLNWTEVQRLNEMYLDDDSSEQLHLPIYNLEQIHMLPNKVSLLQMFTACPRGREPARAGALVICKESVWEKIKKSNLVDEMISDMGT